MSRRHCPLDDEDLLQQILLRLPPKLCSFPRASLVCKRWRSILSDPRFLRRFRKHHRKPTLIGFFDRQSYKPTVFTPILHPPNRIPAARFVLPENLFALEPHATSFSGCRHGIALFLDRYRCKAVLWDPLTGVQHRVAFPPVFQGVGRFDNIIRSATVLCPVGDCPMSPFKLVFAWHGATSTQTFVCGYESKVGVWGDIISIVATHVISQRKPSILVGNALCWLLLGGDILEFDFERLTLAVIKKPAGVDVFNVELSFQILRGEDNGLGLAVLAVSEPNIQLWARKSDSDGIVSWLLQITVQLDELFSQSLCPDKLVLMSGYDEDIRSMDRAKSGVLVKASRPILLPDKIGRSSSARNALFRFVPVLHFLIIESMGDLSYLESFCGLLCLQFFRTLFSLPRDRSAKRAISVFGFA